MSPYLLNKLSELFESIYLMKSFEDTVEGVSSIMM